MPCYNRAHLIGKALKSIETQTYNNWELIVIDDGSTDKTQEIVEQFATQISQSVTFIKQNKNGGVGIARNTGLTYCKGLYIAFLDSDDCWLPFHLQESLCHLENNVCIDWISANYNFIDLDTNKVFIEDGFRKNPANTRPELSLNSELKNGIRVIKDKELLRKSIIFGHMAPLGSSVFRRDVFDDIKFPEGRMHEDTVFWITCLIKRKQFGYADKIQLNVYDHNDRTVVRENVKTDVLEHALRAHINSYNTLKMLSSFKSRLTQQEKQALNYRLGNSCFWIIGYECYLKSKDYKNALQWFQRGLMYRPFNFKYWKTYLTTLIKLFID